MPLPIPEFSFKGKQLTEEQCQIFLGLVMAKEKEIPLGESEIASDFGAKILLKRLECYNLPFVITDFFYGMSTITFVDRPGVVMILLRLCWQEWKKNGTDYFGIEIWANKMFPWGVPENKELETMWDSQKGFACGLEKMDNLLDSPEAWT